MSTAYVRPGSTREDRRLRVELSRRAGRHGKSPQQVRGSERRKAIRESGEGK
jgi:hypothetical protein